MTARVEIPKELAARVLFASDKTCCVCRLERTKVQIHHIDGNPSHNEFANLAVICLNCHSDAHSTGAFVRNLTPELIALYNDSWRQVSAMRLLPSGSDPTKQALQSRDTGRVRDVASAYGADYFVVPWPVENALYRDEYFSVLATVRRQGD